MGIMGRFLIMGNAGFISSTVPGLLRQPTGAHGVWGLGFSGLVCSLAGLALPGLRFSEYIICAAAQRPEVWRKD